MKLQLQHQSSNEYSGNIQEILISFRMDWLDLLAVQGTLKSLLQHHSSKASILQCSAFFTVQLSYPYLICLLRNLYAGQETTVRTGHETTGWFQIGPGPQAWGWQRNTAVSTPTSPYLHPRCRPGRRWGPWPHRAMWLGFRGCREGAGGHRGGGTRVKEGRRSPSSCLPRDEGQAVGPPGQPQGRKG